MFVHYMIYIIALSVICAIYGFSQATKNKLAKNKVYYSHPSINAEIVAAGKLR